MITVAEIRAKYPHPVTLFSTAVDSTVDDYCVGGALCLFLKLNGLPGPSGYFPDEDILAGSLCDANPALPLVQAEAFAENIIRDSDDGNFEAAWQHLDTALGWWPEEVT